MRRWRAADYSGASETTRELLHHWFSRDHVLYLGGGQRVPFRYYFCQREAIETLIYLYEVCGLTSLSALTAEFTSAPDEEGQPGEEARRASLGIHPDEDQWARYAFKLATGAGKTKVMSLAIVWSYFHALRESDSKLARHFVLIAPNLTVFERLKDDFKPSRGGADIFEQVERQRAARFTLRTFIGFTNRRRGAGTRRKLLLGWGRRSRGTRRLIPGRHCGRGSRNIGGCWC